MGRAATITKLKGRQRPDTAVATPQGATATVEGDALVVRDPEGRVLVTYDAARGTATIAAPSGDLRLAAPQGKVVVEGRDLELKAERELALRGGRLAARLEEAAWSVGRWEVRAERIVERARDVFHEVEELVQTRAKRARTLVAETLQMLSRRTRIRSREDTSVDGKRVLLG